MNFLEFLKIKLFGVQIIFGKLQTYQMLQTLFFGIKKCLSQTLVDWN
jgi:hypothetical protein